jgi:betaine-aldehyde dehydrogenase
MFVLAGSPSPSAGLFCPTNIHFIDNILMYDDQKVNSMALVDVEFEEPKMLIDGAFVDSVSGETFESSSPATGAHLADVPRGKPEDIDRAVEAAKTAQQTWYNEYTAKERGDIVREYADLLRDHAEHLGAIDAADGGNPVDMMQSDPMAAAELADIFGGAAMEIKGETIPVSNDTLDYTIRQPYGVVGRIIPFNHPAFFAAGKIAAPLVAGNAIVLKPPEQASLSALELGRLITDADLFPDGLINIVPGFGDEAGGPLVSHGEVHKVGFIGSVPTGKLIQKQAAENVSDVILELGGKNPCLVYPDADLEKAIEGCVQAMNFSWCGGQSCGSTSRLFLHESHYEEGLELLKTKVETVEPGNPLDPDTNMGSLIDEAQYEKVLKYIDIGKASDARLLTGGNHPDGEELADGYFVEPTVFADVTQDMRIAQEEIFGPVLSVLKWQDEKQLIQDANDIKYGLTASIYTNDITRAHRVAEQIEAGYVWVNQAGGHYWGAPFGGFKQSGTGREEAIDELLDFTQVKNVNVQL